MVGCTSFSLKLPNLRSSAGIASGDSAEPGVDMPVSVRGRQHCFPGEETFAYWIESINLYALRRTMSCGTEANFIDRYLAQLRGERLRRR